MPLKHLHFVQSLEPLQGGGLGRAALELHQAMLDKGANSTLVATRAPNFRDSWPNVHQYVRQGPGFLYYSHQLAKNVDTLTESNSFIHAHGLYVAPNWLFGHAAQAKNRLLITHVHGFFEPWILNRSRWKKRLVSALFEGNNLRYSQIWRALTVKEADQIRAQGIKTSIIVAPNGIHLEPFDAQITEKFNITIEKKRNRVLFLGRIHPKKGLDLLIPAWKKLGNTRREWELLIVGPDENGYAKHVSDMVKDQDLGESVQILGAMTGPPKLSLLRSADIFVLPSYSEGFSVAILEALASNVPVIATDACNFPELTEVGGGWGCIPTIESVSAALGQAIQASDNERKERAIAGRRLVEQKYTWPKIATDIMGACQQQFRE